MTRHTLGAYRVYVAMIIAMFILGCTEDTTSGAEGCQLDEQECQLFCEDENKDSLEEYPWGAVTSVWDEATCNCECTMSHCDSYACASWCLEAEGLEDSYCSFNECICEGTDGG